MAEGEEGPELSLNLRLWEDRCPASRPQAVGGQTTFQTSG